MEIAVGIETGNQLKGMAIGVMVFGFFGALWIVSGLVERGTMTVGRVLGAAAGCAVLMAGGILLLRAAGHWPMQPNNPAIGRVFGLVNALQWGAGFTAFFLLRHWHLDDYFLSVLTAIVGLHFVPLARLFRAPSHYAVAAVMVAWAATGVLYLPVEHLPSLTAFGDGLILWQAGAQALAVGLAAARHVPAQTAVSV
jgi:hypothetical protein